MTKIVYIAFVISVMCISICHGSDNTKYNPCCSYPCENFGICNRVGFTDKYICDCYGTGHYGSDCQTPTWGTWFSKMIRPSPFTVQALTRNGEFVWSIVNKIGFLHSAAMKLVLKLLAMSPPWPEPHNTAADYVTWDGYSNKTYWGLTLPPVPANCPTPLGTAGPKVLPDAKLLVTKVFTRTKFKPCPRGTSIMLPLYGQHFTHQGFKSVLSDRTLSWSPHTLDLSHLYGETLKKQLALRSLKGGKMKMQIVNGEEYPPNLKDCPGIEMQFPSHVPEEDKYAMGHPFFALLPSLMYWTTLWLREHNRVCDVLAEEHPDWDDERLFQTTRFIILGETLKMTVESYVQHISGMHLQLTFEPDLMHDLPQRWGSHRIHVEFNTQYHWHNTVPDYFLIGEKNYSLGETYYNMKALTDHGMYEFTTSLSNQVAGRGPGGRNWPKLLHPVAVRVIEMNRKIPLQPLNRYRKYFKLPPYETFEDLTGETKLAKVLSDLYEGDIDAVEYFVGIMVEKRFPTNMWGITLMESIGHYALRGVFSNLIGSPEYWKESTFGGKVGFDIVKSATFEDIACRNIEGCPKIRFKVPGADTEDLKMVYDDIDVDSENHNERSKTEL